MRKLLCVLLLVAFPAFAAEKPAFLEPYVKAGEPSGSATFRKFFIKVYDAALWADGQFSFEKPFALALTYDVRIDTDDFVARTLEEIEASSDAKAGELEKWKPELARVFPNVKAGDTITAVHVPKKGVRFFFNGKETGEIKDTQFTRQFFGIWLAPTTTEPEFRKALLGGQGA